MAKKRRRRRRWRWDRPKDPKVVGWGGTEPERGGGRKVREKTKSSGEVKMKRKEWCMKRQREEGEKGGEQRERKRKKSSEAG